MNITVARPGGPSIHRDVPSDSFAGYVNLRDGSGPTVIRCQTQAQRKFDNPPLLQHPEGWIAFHGRLDARADLARALGVENEPAIPDIELVRRALDKWQADAPQHLIGDFAIAAWTERDRRLLFAADIGGLNTVYFWRHGDRLHFSTCLRELLRDTPAPGDLNEEYIADCIAMNLADNDATPYRHIRKVAAATCVATTADRETVFTYHRYDPERRVQLANDHEYQEAAWELLQQAVRDRIRGLDTVCIMSSGGLDSAAVAAATAAVHTGSFEYVTAIPDLALPTIPLHKTRKNEQHLVELLKPAFPAMNTNFVAPAAGQNWDPGWPEHLHANHAPHRSSLHVAWFDQACRKAAQVGASTFLGGGGGNMTLTWDGWRRLPALFAGGHCAEAAMELLQGCGGSPRRFAGLTWRELIRPLLGPRYDYRSLEKYAGLRRQAVDDLQLFQRMQAAGNDPSFVRSRNSRVWRVQVLQRGRARRTELTNMHRTLYGLTQSTPLLDQRLVEFCLAIPEDQYLRHGNFRWLARRLLLAAGVPAAVAENCRVGYQHPEWFAHLTEARPAMREQLARLRKSPLANRLIDTERLESILNLWPAHPIAAERLRNELGSVLAGGVAVGAFVDWAEAGRRARSAAAAPEQG